MEPAIKASSRVTFNKCFENKENLAVGTIILYNGERGSSIARIKETFGTFGYKSTKKNY